MAGTQIWAVQNLVKYAESISTQINGQWVPARPLGWTGLLYRLRAAWMVFSGRADAVTWPRQETVNK